jgi:hypothetical protein
MHPRFPIAVLASAGALALTAMPALAPSASATVVLIEYSTQHPPTSGFPEGGGPRWTGFVDTAADTLTIETWEELSSDPIYWRPHDSSLPLVWPAVKFGGGEYDVPDSFRGEIDLSFAFVSEVSADNMLWHEGDWTPTIAGVDFYPGWGGARWVQPGDLTLSYRTDFDETAMPRLLAALDHPTVNWQIIGATATKVTATVTEPVASVPEASAFLFGCIPIAAASSIAMWCSIRRRCAAFPASGHPRRQNGLTISPSAR